MTRNQKKARYSGQKSEEKIPLQQNLDLGFNEKSPYTAVPMQTYEMHNVWGHNNMVQQSSMD